MELPVKAGALYMFISQKLSDFGIETADIEARRILEKRTGMGWPDLIARPDKALSAVEINHIEGDVRRRLQGEPLSRIHGERQFWGLDFELSDETLDPRPDTETLVEAVLKGADKEKNIKILDLGTGTGCILIALLKELPQATGVGIDKSFEAALTARKNAHRHDVSGRAAFLCGDWAGALSGSFDVIVSNPPYISESEMTMLAREVKNHDPILALSGGKDGLQAYKIIFGQIFSLFKPGAKGFFEIGKSQAADVMRLAEESGFFVAHVHQDLAGCNRVVEIACGDK